MIFEGKMNADRYINILDLGLKPFIRDVIRDCKFMQDKEPKHTCTSKKAQQWFENESINWWKTPTESPDINTIENLWHKL